MVLEWVMVLECAIQHLPDYSRGVPIPKTLDYLMELLGLNGLDDKIVKEYIRLTSICMNQNCFEYNGEYFQQHEGTAMCNSLSPFIANIFMSKFETEVKDKFEYFPRVWFRYVDDICAVFDTTTISLDHFVAKLNNRFPTIKFTYEVEHNEHLPFLDVLSIRNSENKKETATLRYIPNDSHHPFQHKMASFNFLIHRLLNFPLSKERFEHEKQLIKNIAKNNGYSVHLIDKLLRKHKFKRTLYNCTTFRRDTDNSKFASNVTNSRQLDAFESLEIIKCNSSMNMDNGPIPTSPLFALINKDNYGSVNRGNKFSINGARTIGSLTKPCEDTALNVMCADQFTRLTKARLDFRESGKIIVATSTLLMSEKKISKS
ncbi:hypothetical protein NQ318_010769 [Aromia moschata]|uniref:Helix-turn-helix domain-containing protein n=1 Tax=Aromia moschata TaxID=1265417 RepID=A0AAV8YY16_9CUCU|nr:hypothetical protein NQ318_010769 [Aromia moschata]